MRLVRLLGCALALALMGCGGDDGDGPGGSSQRYACDINAGTASSHACVEFSWVGAANAADAYKSACQQGGATAVSSCPSSGKVGGCKYVATSGSVSVTWVYWYYFGTAAQLMQGCVSPGGGVTATWVNP